MNLKGWLHQKNTNSVIFFLILEFLSNLYAFISSAEHKGSILKNMGDQAVDRPH